MQIKLILLPENSLYGNRVVDYIEKCSVNKNIELGLI